MGGRVGLTQRSAHPLDQIGKSLVLDGHLVILDVRLRGDYLRIRRFVLLPVAFVPDVECIGHLGVAARERGNEARVDAA